VIFSRPSVPQKHRNHVLILFPLFADYLSRCSRGFSLHRFHKALIEVLFQAGSPFTVSPFRLLRNGAASGPSTIIAFRSELEDPFFSFVFSPLLLFPGRMMTEFQIDLLYGSLSRSR